MFKNGKTVLLVLVLVTVTFASGAQNTCSCTKAEKLKPQIGYYFNTGDFDSARVVINKIKEKNTSKICEIIYYNSLSQVAMGEKNFSQARIYLNKEYDLLKKVNCPERMAKHYTNMSLFYNFMNKQDSATHVSLLGLTQAELALDTVTQIRLCSNIGAFFHQMKQYKKALKYEEKAMNLARKLNEDYSKAMIYTQVGQTYLSLYDRTKDKSYLRKALNAGDIGLKSATNAQLLLLALDAYGVLSQHAIYKKDYETALKYADSILLFSPRKGNFFNHNLQAAFSKKSVVYYELGNYKMAKLNADSAVYFGNLFNVQLTIGPYELIYKSSKKLGDYASSLAAYERMKFLEDSLFSIEKNGIIAELEQKYNQVKNEKTIKELNQEDEIKSLRIRTLLILIVGVLFALLVVVLIFRQKNLKKNQHILQTEQRLNRSRMNPHFFFNALTSLQGLALRENDGKKVAINLYKFSSLMRKTLESSYNDYVTVDEELSFINQYIELQQIKDQSKFRFEIKIDEEFESDAILIPSMLIQPFLENSIEHGFSDIDYQGELIVLLGIENNMLRVAIEDNGKGLKAHKTVSNHISRATEITKDRLELLKKNTKENAHFSIREQMPKGIIVEIILPLRYK